MLTCKVKSQKKEENYFLNSMEDETRFIGEIAFIVSFNLLLMACNSTNDTSNSGIFVVVFFTLL